MNSKDKNSEEAYLETIIGFQDSLIGLNEIYGKLVKLIEHENVVLVKQDLSQHEKILTEKHTLSDQIAKIVNRIQAMQSILAPEAQTLNDIYKMILEKARSKDFTMQAFRANLFQYALKKIDFELKVFDREFKTLKPLVEKNIYIVNRVLTRHQDKIKMFVNCRGQSEMGYSSAGEVKKLIKNSVLEVEA